MPRVSIVVPSFNNAAHISETIRSILDQTYSDFELIVADHGSADDTYKILEGFDSDPRMTLLTTEPGGGAVRNWNRVSEVASGPLLKLVCGDDVLHPDGLRLQVEALSQDPNASMVASPRRLIDSDGRTLVRKRGLAGLTGPVPGPVATRRMVRAGSNIFGEPVCVLMSRDALESASWWDARFPFVIDQATYVRLLRSGGLVALPEVVADFRINAGQLSVALSKEQYVQVSSFHRWVAEAYPEAVDQSDVRIGNARARMVAASRRSVYWVMARQPLR